MSEQFVGEIRMFAGNYAPTDWAMCWGQTLTITDYSMLFSLVGTIWGGDGRQTFKLPDLRGRVPIGQGVGSGLTQRIIGQTLGYESVVLSEANLPTHNHSFTVTSANADLSSPEGAYFGALNPVGGGDVNGLYVDPAQVGTATVTMQTFYEDVISAAGGTSGHENRMPSLAINYIIALDGEYPTRP